jgi:hypothetical protein
LKRRRITLEDGRYLIFYTFDEESAPRAADDTGGEHCEEEPEPEAEEERSV